VRGHIGSIFETWPDIEFTARRLYVRDGLVVQEWTAPATPAAQTPKAAALDGACTSALMTADFASPGVLGTTVTFTASSIGCPNPLYQWWINNAGVWTIIAGHDFAHSSATFAWNTTGLPEGTYQVGVWAKQTGSNNSYDTFAFVTYTLTITHCTAVNLGTSVASPQVVGATVTFTPQQTGCASQYKFWLLPPNGKWVVVQKYGVGSTWTWNTAAYGPGIYQVSVWEGSSSTPSSYQSYAITTFTLDPAGCASTTLSPSTAPPQTPGTTITLTASSTGCSSPTYEFWLLPPGGAWTIERGYGDASWDWNTTGLARGLYWVGVWARQAGSIAKYDTYFTGSFQLTVPLCTSATLGASPPSPQASGTAITFTASSSGCSAPRYEFWEQAPGGVWKVVQSWDTGATFSWNSTAAAVGDYNFAVTALATGSPGPYDSYALATFSINS